VHDRDARRRVAVLCQRKRHTALRGWRVFVLRGMSARRQCWAEVLLKKSCEQRVKAKGDADN